MVHQISSNSSSPVHKKHDYHTEKCCKKREPRIIVTECWPPVWSFGDARMKHGKVDQGKRSHKKVGQDT